MQADVRIRLGGQDYRLRPAYGAIREIEAECGHSCNTLLQLLAKCDLTAEEMVCIVFHGMVAAGETNATKAAVGDRLFEAGLGSQAVQESVGKYLIECLYAPDASRKKAAGEWLAKVVSLTSLLFSMPRAGSDGDPETSGDSLPGSSGSASKPSVKGPSVPAATPPTPAEESPDDGGEPRRTK